jgi:hypothetical protein
MCGPPVTWRSPFQDFAARAISISSVVLNLNVAVSGMTYQPTDYWAAPSSHASTPPASSCCLKNVSLPPLCVAKTTVSAVRARSFRPSRSQSKPAWDIRANGLSRLQPNRSSGPHPSASARAAQPSSRNRPQSSMKRNHRVGGISQGGQAGSSRARASAQTLGAPPLCSAMAARSFRAAPQR